MSKRRGARAIAGLVTAVACFGGLAACGEDDETGATTGATAATTAAGGSGIDPSKPPVRIPVIAIKLPGLDMLTPYAAGAKAAAHKINAEGGFGGREVVIEECATAMDPASAAACANRTLEQGDVLTEIGCEITWSASGLEIYARAKVPSLNCTNSHEDFTHSWSFGNHPGAFGEHAAVAAWLCEQDDVQDIVMLGQDIPQQRRDEPAATKPIVEGCGKQIDYVFVPTDATDWTPYVNEVLDHDPDFVITQQSPAPTAQMYKAFQQAGYPAEQTSAVGSSCGYEQVLELAGSAMEGAMCTEAFVPWSDEDDPEVAEYVEAMEASGAEFDHRHSNPQWGYSTVMFLHEAAKEIGFDELTPDSLADYLRRADGVPIPLSKDWINPGPKGRPAVKQPATLLLRWQDGAMQVVEEDTDDGWIDGFAALDAAGGG